MGAPDDRLGATLQTPQALAPTHTPQAIAGTHTPVSLGRATADAELPVAPPTRYVIERDLGQGGQSIVYAALDSVMGREVALKTSRDPAASASFIREVRITAQLEHPGIVPVHELGRTARGEFFCTQKLVRGRTLRSALDEAKTLDARLALLPHLVDVCNAMAYAHSRGVVHRDLKPENVMVGEFGETVVLDWGVARVRGAEHVEVERPLAALGPGETQLGAIVGTPMYLSPEQARGKSSEVDARSDVWSLGVMLYELVAGRRPFEADKLEALLIKTVEGKYPPLSVVCADAPPELDAVVAKAMRLEPSQRYADARALAGDLSAFRVGGRVAVYRYSSWELLRRFVARNKALTALASVFTVGVVVALLYVTWAQRQLVVQMGLSNENLAYSLGEQALNAERRQLWNEAYAHYELALTYADFSADRWAKALVSPLVAEASERWSGGRTDDELTIDRITWAVFEPESDVGLAFDYRLGKVLGHDASGWHVLATTEVSGLGAIHGRSMAWIAGSAWLSLDGAAPREVAGTQNAKTLAFSSDGRRLAVGRPGEVKIFDGSTLAELSTLSGGTDYPYVLSFSPDGARLAASAEDGTVRWWTLSTGKLTVGTGPRAAMLSLAFSPDGKRLFSGDGERNLWMWSLETATSEGQLVGHDLAIEALALDPLGDLLASASRDGSLVLWDLKRLRPVQRFSTQGRELFAVGFSKDGQRVDAVDTSGKRWSWKTKGARQAMAVASCASRQMAVDVAWSPNQSALVYACKGNPLVVVENGVARPIRLEGSEVTALLFSSDGAQLWVGTARGVMEVWSSKTWALQREVRLAPEARVTFAGAADVKGAWATFGGTAAHIDGADFTPGPPLAGTKAVLRVDVAADGKTVAWMDDDYAVWVGTASGGAQPRKVALPGASRRLRFNPRGDVLAAVGDYGAAVMTLASGEVHVLEQSSRLGFRAHWSPDGSVLAVGGAEGVALYDIARRRLLARVPGDLFEVSAVAWSPDGRALALGNTAGHLFLRQLGPEVSVGPAK